MKGAGTATFLVTCEHGGNRVPPRFRPLFPAGEPLLRTHRGYDRGALRMARDIAQALQAPLQAATTSRLLVDLNRSPHHPGLFSEFTRQAPAEIRAAILHDCYAPYRKQAEAAVEAARAAGRRLLHLSSHSFTPVLDGTVRNTDIGLLYDPRRPAELDFCLDWQEALHQRVPHLRVRRNYPYTGSSDGLCAHLRKLCPDPSYLGVELEINQKHVEHGGDEWHELRIAVVDALLEACARLFAKNGRVGV